MNQENLIDLQQMRGAAKGMRANWMQTVSGGLFYPTDPVPEEVLIFDIAHALSMMCRFGGHCKHFYSVAEHSVLVSRQVPPEHALAGLLHDAAEAYASDIVRPLKVELRGYVEIEERIMLAIAKKFGLVYPLDKCIKQADNAVLLAEKEMLLPPCPHSWNVPGIPAPVSIQCLPPSAARARFLNRYKELTS